MAKHNLNNIIIDRVLRGIFSDKNDDIIFSLNQVQNLSMNSTSESQEVVDALGVSIMELMRSKAIEVSAENAIYDFSLLAAQYGTEKVEGAAGAAIKSVPVMESFTVNAEKTHTLKHTPTKAPKAIYKLNGDSTLGAKYEKAAESAATATEFTISDQTISLPTGVQAGDEMFVMYEYETESAIEVINKSNEFAKMGKMTFEILAYDLMGVYIKHLG